MRVADIPGVIEGAHRNRGLGHEFLRHVARTRALMFVVDAAGSEGRDPAEDLRSVRDELQLYDRELVDKPAFVVANKMDLPGEGGVCMCLSAFVALLPISLVCNVKPEHRLFWCVPVHC